MFNYGFFGYDNEEATAVDASCEKYTKAETIELFRDSLRNGKLCILDNFDAEIKGDKLEEIISRIKEEMVGVVYVIPEENEEVTELSAWRKGSVKCWKMDTSLIVTDKDKEVEIKDGNKAMSQEEALEWFKSRYNKVLAKRDSLSKLCNSFDRATLRADALRYKYDAESFGLDTSDWRNIE